MTSFLRVFGPAWSVVLLVVLVGAFRPETPVLGLAGSFLTGRYPLHVALAAVLGILLGLAVRKAGAPLVGYATATVALAAVIGMVAVLAAQGRAAAGEGVRLDWTAALTRVGQPSGEPDRTVEFAPGRELDLYLPSGPGPHPTMVWVHGGSWVGGERDDRTTMNRWLADRGWAVAAVDYRLPETGWGAADAAPVGRDQQRDVACAVDWVRAHPGTELDPGRLVLAGQSAGATLALGTTSGLLDGTLACSEAPAAYGGTGPAPPALPRRRSCPAQDSEIQKPGSPETRKPGNPETQKPRSPEAQKPRNPETQKPRNPGTQEPRSPEAQKTQTQKSRKPENQRNPPGGKKELQKK